MKYSDASNIINSKIKVYERMLKQAEQKEDFEGQLWARGVISTAKGLADDFDHFQFLEEARNGLSKKNQSKKDEPKVSKASKSDAQEKSPR